MTPVFSEYSFVDAGFYNAEESRNTPPPFLMNQPHGADVVVLNELPTHPLLCDALVSDKPGIQLTVKTADCAPVLFLDTEARIIGAAHAGWKGAFQGILENTILSMLSLGAHIENIHAAVGPHLTQQNFQISSSMQNLFSQTESLFFHETPNGIYFDFSGYIQHRLNRVGIRNIDMSPIDTYADSAYNSYRRDPQNPARQYSFIKLK